MTNEKPQIKKLYALSSENRKFSFSLPLKAYYQDRQKGL